MSKLTNIFHVNIAIRSFSLHAIFFSTAINNYNKNLSSGDCHRLDQTGYTYKHYPVT